MYPGIMIGKIIDLKEGQVQKNNILQRIVTSKSVLSFFLLASLKEAFISDQELGVGHTCITIRDT